MSKQILCRVDANNSPVVFLADSLENGTIKAWTMGAKEVKAMPVDYYAQTRPLSEADTRILSSRFAKFVGDESVTVRQRLPRVYRELPNLLARAPRASAQAQEAPIKGSNGKAAGKTPSASAARKAAAKAQYAKDLAASNAAAGAGQMPPALANIPGMDNPQFAALVAGIANALAQAGQVPSVTPPKA
jgi:hypothetical protein